MKRVGEGGGCLAKELCQRCNRVLAILISQGCKAESQAKTKIMVNLRKGIGDVFGILQTLSSEMRALTSLGALLFRLFRTSPLWIGPISIMMANIQWVVFFYINMHVPCKLLLIASYIFMETSETANNQMYTSCVTCSGLSPLKYLEQTTKDRLRNATSAEAGADLLVEVLKRFIVQQVSTRRGGMLEEFGILRSCHDRAHDNTTQLQARTCTKLRLVANFKIVHCLNLMDFNEIFIRVCIYI